jgi:ankyrin repeat protein
MTIGSQNMMGAKELNEQLMRAASRGEEEGVGKWLAQGADPNYCSSYNAAIHNFMANFEGNANPDKNPVLIAAVLSGSEGCVDKLLAAGADVNQVITTDKGKTRSALMLATMNGHVRMVEMLLERGADTLCTRSTKKDSTALSMVPTSSPELFSVLLKYPQTKMALIRELTNASRFAWPDPTVAVGVAKSLLDAGADANGEYEGSTPLIQAAALSSTALAELYIAHGADVHKKTRMPSAPTYHACLPMYHACQAGSSACVYLLTAHGVVADVNDLSVAVMKKYDATILAVLQKYAA